MGATFGNIQLLNQEHLNRDTLISLIRKGCTEKGYMESSDGELVFHLFYHPLKKWSCLYSNALEYTNPSDLKKLACFLNKLLSTDIIASNIYDSDLLMMCLCGKERDFFISDPTGMYGDTNHSDLNKWEYLLNEQQTIDELNEVINKDDVIFEEDRLMEIGNLLGIDSHLSGNGYSGMEDLDAEQLSDYEIIQLSFKCMSDNPAIPVYYNDYLH